MIFTDIYYFDEEKISSLYHQLPNSREGSSTEVSKHIDTSLSSTFKSILLKLAGVDIDIDSEVSVGKSKHETITRKTESLDRLFGILKEIGENDEKNFKDIYHLIEKYLQNEENIFSVGKGEFEFLPLKGDKVPNAVLGVEFPVELDNLDCLLFSCKYEKESNYAELFHKLNKHLRGKSSYYFSEIIVPNEADVTPPIYSKRVFMIIEPSKIVDSFGLRHTYNRTFYFLGRITRTGNNYFIFPYALWGDCVIL